MAMSLLSWLFSLVSWQGQPVRCWGRRSGQL